MAFVYQPPGTIPPPPYAASNPIQYSSPRPTMPLPPGAQVPPPNAYIQQQQRIIAAQQQHILASQQRTHPSVPRGTIPQTATANGPQTVGAYPYPQLSYGYAADQAYPIVAQSPHTHLQQQQQQHMLRQPNRTPHMAHVATPVQPLTPSQSSPVVMARPPSSGRGAAAQAYPQPVQRPPALAEGQQAHSNQQVRPPQPQPTQSQSARSAPTPRQASVTPVATHQPYPIASTPAATLSTAQTPVDADRADAAKGSQPGSAVISKAISPHPPSTPRSLRVKTEQIPGTAGNTPPTVDGQNDDRVAGVGASPAAQSELSRSFATTTTALYPTYEVVGASGAGGAYMMLPGGVWSDPGSSVVEYV